MLSPVPPMKRKPYTPFIPFDEELPKPVQHDSQGLIDAVKAEFFPEEAGQWYTVALAGQFDSVQRTNTAPLTDSFTDFACLAALYAPVR